MSAETHTRTWRVPRTGRALQPLRTQLALTTILLAPFLVTLAPFPSARTSPRRTRRSSSSSVVVVAVAALGSRTTAVVAALSAAAWFDFFPFFTRPYKTFDITASGDIETAVLLLVVGLVLSQLGPVRWVV